MCVCVGVCVCVCVCVCARVCVCVCEREREREREREKREENREKNRERSLNSLILNPVRFFSKSANVVSDQIYTHIKSGPIEPILLQITRYLSLYN